MLRLLQSLFGATAKTVVETAASVSVCNGCQVKSASNCRGHLTAAFPAIIADFLLASKKTCDPQEPADVIAVTTGLANATDEKGQLRPLELPTEPALRQWVFAEIQSGITKYML